ncbi:MAG TPA: HDOD domain-containing protein [Gemmatimonadales bacterium]|nr:HDOD domain-containing protein [Gemmatimonadales bacterium]
MGGPPLALSLEGREADLEAWIRAELALRVNELADRLPAGPGAGASRLLLDELQGDVVGAIRRPPAAAQEALAAVRESDGDVRRVVAVFERDPVLAQALLKRANASYYAASRGPCESLLEAAHRIGLDGIHGVLLANTIEGLLCRPGSEYAGMVEQVWSHMVRSAPIARRVAPAFGVKPEQAFTIALLHDVGKLVLFDRLSLLRSRRRRTPELPAGFLPAALRRLHEPLGGVTATVWGLGAPLARAIFTHHRNPLRYAGDRLSEVACLAERVDLAGAAGRPLDLPTLWADADLSGEPERVAALLAEPPVG